LGAGRHQADLIICLIRGAGGSGCLGVLSFGLRGAVYKRLRAESPRHLNKPAGAQVSGASQAAWPLRLRGRRCQRRS